MFGCRPTPEEIGLRTREIPTILMRSTDIHTSDLDRISLYREGSICRMTFHFDYHIMSIYGINIPKPHSMFTCACVSSMMPSPPLARVLGERPSVQDAGA